MSQRLRRDIGFSGSAFLAFNGMIGAGIFALPGTLHQQFGAFSPWLFPIFGLLVLLVALPFARLASRFTESGGPVAYTAVFGPVVSFQVGWIYYVARATALAANANVFAIYAAAMLPALDGAVGRAAVIVTLVGAITVVNITGVRRAVRLLDALTLLKALPLVGIALWGLAAANALPAPGPMPELDGIEAAALLVLYAFVGFESLLVPAGETARPERTIPRALLATIGGTALLYFLVQLAYVAVMPAGDAPEAPLVAFATVLAGSTGALVMSVAAMVSVAGNITSSVTSTPRVTFAMAEERMLPRWFGLVSARWNTPANSILFMGLIGLVLALSGSFVWLAVASTLARMVVYSASIAALPRIERSRGRLTSTTALVMAPALIVCLWAAAQSEWKSWGVLALLLGLGLVLGLVARIGRT